MDVKRMRQEYKKIHVYIAKFSPEEAVLLDSESLSVNWKFISVIREVNYTNYKTEWKD